MGTRNQHTFKKGHPNYLKSHSEESKRKIRETPVVHHINGDHNDNRPENRIILTRSEHAIIHQLQGDVGFQKGQHLGNKYWKKRKNAA